MRRGRRSSARRGYDALLPGHPVTLGVGVRMITVCAACLQASCWQGIFYCDEYKTANVVQKTRAELEQLGLEHPSYWKTDAELADEV